MPAAPPRGCGPWTLGTCCWINYQKFELVKLDIVSCDSKWVSYLRGSYETWSECLVASCWNRERSLTSSESIESLLLLPLTLGQFALCFLGSFLVSLVTHYLSI